MDKDYGVQEVRQLAEPLGYGLDSHGKYQTIPLSMVRGGKRKPYRVYLDPIKHLIKGTTPAPRGWYKAKNEPPRVRPRPCYTEALLTTPYGGFCPINCGHCYVNNGTRGYRATGLPVAHIEYPQAMKKWVAKLMVSGAAYITSFSEPFHPLEGRYHITRDLTQVFLDEGLPIFYLSRKIPPDWAIDALLENPYSYMQWSVNTSNNDHYRRMSPGSFTLEQVYDSIENLHNLGIFVSIQCNPIMAGITSLDEVVQLVHNVAQCGANHIIFKFVEQVSNNRRVVVDTARKRGLPNVDEFDRLFSQVIGGVYTIQEDVRIEWLEVLLEETRTVDLTMSLCYEYYDNGAAGGNLAPYFTTADQCHGRGIPVYFRPETGAPFEPLPGCYRKGCLYCLEYGTKVCANEALLEAKALKYADLRSIRLTGDARNWHEAESCWSPGELRFNGADAADIVYGNPYMQTDDELWQWGADSDCKWMADEW